MPITPVAPLAHLRPSGVDLYHAAVEDFPLEPMAYDAMFCDPPYGLEFMGNGWDKGVPPAEVWRKLYAALKPGAHALIFGGSRTYHRLATEVEDAGFEIRDCWMWLYGSGFPKGQDTSKAIDAAAGTTGKRKVRGTRTYGDNVACKNPTLDSGTFEAARGGRRHVANTVPGYGYGNQDPARDTRLLTTPGCHRAEQWDGYNTTLKPAYELLCVAQRPLEGTMVQNLVRHGTGALNIGAGRIGTTGGCNFEAAKGKGKRRAGDSKNTYGDGLNNLSSGKVEGLGRWPTNVVIDEAVAAELDAPSRFFYVAKASPAERGPGNAHPTVKPLKLCERWAALILPAPRKRTGPRRLLVPFSGSGSECLAAMSVGWEAVTAIERDMGYINTAYNRLTRAGFEAHLR